MGEWKNETSNLAGMTSECGNLSVLSVKPDEDMLIASVAQQGLWSSTDGGTTWTALGTGAMSDKVTNRGSSLVYDPDHPQTFYESGTYNGGGVYQTTDDGVTLLQLGDTTHSDLVSVDFTDPDRKTLLAGGHEQGHALSRSIDAGMTWANIGANLPDNTNCTFPLIIDGMTYLVGCGGYGGGIAGIGRSTDGGMTWTQVSSSGGSRVPLVASDGSIYWSTAVNGGLARSTDKGVTWSQTVGTGVLMTDPPIELPDGRIAAVGSSAIVVSADQGVTWTAVTSEIPYIKSVGYNDAGGVLYSVPQKAFYVYHSDCGNSVPSDAVLRYDFDYMTE